MSVCVKVYVCMHVCMHLYIYIYTYISPDFPPMIIHIHPCLKWGRRSRMAVARWHLDLFSGEVPKWSRPAAATCDALYVCYMINFRMRSEGLSFNSGSLGAGGVFTYFFVLYIYISLINVFIYQCLSIYLSIYGSCFCLRHLFV